MMETTKAHSARSAEGLRLRVKQHLKGVEVYGSQSHFWKKVVQKMRAHASSEAHVRRFESELLTNRGATEQSEILRESRTAMPWSHFFDIPTSCPNSTFLTPQSSVS